MTHRREVSPSDGKDEVLVPRGRLEYTYAAMLKVGGVGDVLECGEARKIYV